MEPLCPICLKKLDDETLLGEKIMGISQDRVLCHMNCLKE